MDQFLISQTPDSLNKQRIVQTGWRPALFTGVFVFLGGQYVNAHPTPSSWQKLTGLSLTSNGSV